MFTSIISDQMIFPLLKLKRQTHLCCKNCKYVAQEYREKQCKKCNQLL